MQPDMQPGPGTQRMFSAYSGNKGAMDQPAGMALPPIPASVSAAARQSLARPVERRPPLPDARDVRGWLRHIEDADGAVLTWYRGQESPMNAAADAAVTERRYAGVRTFVAHDPQLPADARTPVYLEFHGGAFIYGSGELCRLSTGFTALDKGMTVWGVDYRMPPVHPFDPGKALRLAVAAGSEIGCIREIYRFIWRDGRDPSTPEGFRDLCHHVGLPDGEKLIEQEDVKARLRANNDLAVSLGVFGVPSFVVNDQLFWGEDTLPMVLYVARSPNWLDGAEVQRISNLPRTAPAV